MRSSAGLDARRKRLLFRSWHRGTRELDLIMGRFADAWLDRLEPADLDAYEWLLEVPDQELFRWVTGEQPVPEAADTPLFRKLRAFHRDAPPVD